MTIQIYIHLNKCIGFPDIYSAFQFIKWKLFTPGRSTKLTFQGQSLEKTDPPPQENKERKKDKSISNKKHFYKNHDKSTCKEKTKALQKGASAAVA